MAPGSWEHAKCKDTAIRHEDGTLEDPFFEGPEEEAQAICRDPANPCPIMEQCLLFALVNNEKHGVWGGHGEADRRAIRKKYPLKRGKEPRPEWEVFEVGEPASWFAPEELEDDGED